MTLLHEGWIVEQTTGHRGVLLNPPRRIACHETGSIIWKKREWVDEQVAVLKENGFESRVTAVYLAAEE